MNMRHDDTLIYDLGFYDGSDSRYYLDKGFRVVAVEADPAAVVRARDGFARELTSGVLTLVDRAVAERPGETIAFYLDPREGSAFHSIHRVAAERGGAGSVAVDVETTTVPALFDLHGVPRYLKCDIEGADDIVVEQIARDGRRPPFLSIEVFDREAIERLRDAGYDRFQLVNQGHLSRFRPPRPAREGRRVDVAFGAAHSGLFGLDLPRRHWCDVRTCLRRFDRWKHMKLDGGPLARLSKHVGRVSGRSWLDCTGWMDVHATTLEHLC
ncbi:MAG: FkbM family methyltransferase [Rhodobiaceae bacterium]|nr:FkbM family methyltransferase [Rhodobiaceae bacterium]